MKRVKRFASSSDKTSLRQVFFRLCNVYLHNERLAFMREAKRLHRYQINSKSADDSKNFLLRKSIRIQQVEKCIYFQESWVILYDE